MTGSSGQSAATTTTSGPPPQVLADYQKLNDAATAQVSQPIPQYSGPMVAGFTPDQQQAMTTIGNSQGIGLPYINSAAQEFGQATTPLWPTLPQFGQDQVDKFSSPYTKNVTDALTNLYSQQNQQQQQQIQGDATSRGAYGGDREAVAQSLAAQQEALAQAPTIAQVQNQGYQTALGEFNNQQQQQLAAEQANAWLGSQAGFGLAGLGQQAQNEALTGASSQLQSGALQQQLAQEQLNIPYQQFQQSVASPYQQLNFLAGITEGTGSLSGGVGSTTPPAPSTLGQIAGLGVAGLGAAGAAGLFSGNSGSTGAASGATDVLGSGFGGGNFSDPFLAARGGRIGYAPGGGIGIGLPNIPDVAIDIIPPVKVPGNGTPGFNLNDTTQTTSGGSSGGGDILSALGPIAGIAKLFLASGGRAGYDDGGGIGTTSALGLPKVPVIGFDKLIPPGPTIKGSGPPAPPKVAPSTTPTLAQDLTGLGSAVGKINKSSSSDSGNNSGNSNSSSSDTSADTATSSDSSRQDYDAGGYAAPTPAAGATPVQGSSPNTQNLYGQYSNMSLEQLQELAVRVPASTPQGSMIQRALQMKRVAPQGDSGIGNAPVLGSASAAPQAPVSPMPSTGGTSHLASGGEPGYVTPDELDEHPIVDHSGPTVKIRYPSEGGKVLDLGLPSIPGMRDQSNHFAAGGSSGPMVSSFTAPNGVSIPILSTAITAGPGNQGNPTMAPGAGRGDFFQPLAQFRPPGTTTNANGALMFPSTPGLSSAFGVPGIGGAAPAAAAAAAPVTPIIPDVSTSTFTASDGGGKRGGNVDHFDDGGATGDDLAATGVSGAGPGTLDTLSRHGASVVDSTTADSGIGLPSFLVPEKPRFHIDKAALGSDYSSEPPASATGTGGAGVGAQGSADSDTPSLTSRSSSPAWKDWVSSLDTAAGQGTKDVLAEHAAEPSEPWFGRALTLGQLSPHGGTMPIPLNEDRPTASASGTAGTGAQASAAGDEAVPAPQAATAAMVAPAKANLVSGPALGRSKFQGDASLAGDPGGIGLADFRSDFPPVKPEAPADVPLYGPKGEPWTPPAGDAAGRAPGIGAEPVGRPQDVSPSGPQIAKTVVDTGRNEAHLSDAALTGIIANGLGEGGFNTPWQKAWGNENSYGHWQLYEKGELPGYDAFLSAQNLPRDSHSQTLYVAKRMEEIHPGFSQITDPKLATDLVATQFERYKNAAPGDRYSLIPNAQKIIAGDYSGGLGPTAHGGGSGRLSPEEASGIGGGENMTPRGAISDAPPGADKINAAISHLDRTAPTDEHGNKDWVHSPWFPVIAAGLGMMASKSPYPGVAIGEGGLQGIRAAENMAGQQNKQEVAGIRAQHLNDMADVKQTAAAAAAVKDAAHLKFQYDALDEKVKAGTATLAETTLKNQLANELAVAVEDRKRREAALKAAKPMQAFNLNPDTGKLDYGSQVYDPDQGKYVFTAGPSVGRPPVATGENAVIQRMKDEPGGPQTTREALEQITLAKTSPQAKQKIDLAIEAEARHQASLDATTFAAAHPMQPFNVQAAEQKHLQALREKMYPAAPATPAPAAAPATTAALAQPAAATPSAPKPPDQATATSSATAAIAAHPEARPQILKQMQDWGFSPAGL